MEYDHDESGDAGGPPPGRTMEIHFLKEAVDYLESTFNIPSLLSDDYEALLAAASKASDVLVQAEAQVMRRINDELEESYREANK